MTRWSGRDRRWLVAGLVASSVAVAVAAVSLWSTPPPTQDTSAVFERTKLVRYGFTLRNVSGEPLEDSVFRVFAPVRETSVQRTLSIEASHPYELIEDALGNQILEFRLAIPPYGAKVVSISAELELAGTPNVSPIPAGDAYRRAEPHVEVDDDEVRAVAASLAGESAAETARAAFEWVSSSLDDMGYERRDRGAAWALRERRGDCTEHMYLFTALARARGIPARGLGGFVVGESGVLRSADYHNWAEFHDGRSWQLVDPQKGVFEENADDYIVMRIIGEAEASPMGNSHRFLAFDDHVEVKMN